MRSLVVYLLSKSSRAVHKNSIICHVRHASQIRAFTNSLRLGVFAWVSLARVVGVMHKILGRMVTRLTTYRWYHSNYIAFLHHIADAGTEIDVPLFVIE